MKKLLWFVLFWTSMAGAQVVGPGFVNYVTSAPSGTCSQGSQMQVVLGSGAVYTCGGTWTQVGGAASVSSVFGQTGAVPNLSGDVTTTNSSVTTLATVNANVGSFTNANITVNAKGLVTAAANGTGGGAFSALTSGTNTTAAMIVGAGATLGFSGSGQVNTSLPILGPSPYCDIVAEGADPTGVADSTSAITACVTAMPSTGGTIHAEAGSYSIATPPLVINKANVIFEGEGSHPYTAASAAATTFTCSVTAGDCIQVNAVQGVVLKNLAILIPSGATWVGLHMSNNGQYELHNVKVRQTAGKNGTCFLHDGAGNSNGIVEDHSYFTGCAVGMDYEGSYAHISIENSAVLGNVDGLHFGTNAGTPAATGPIRIRANDIEQNTGFNIKIYAGLVPDISNNYFEINGASAQLLALGDPVLVGGGGHTLNIYKPTFSRNSIHCTTGPTNLIVINQATQPAIVQNGFDGSCTNTVINNDPNALGRNVAISFVDNISAGVNFSATCIDSFAHFAAYDGVCGVQTTQGLGIASGSTGFNLFDPTDTTKLVRFDLTGLTTGTTSTLKVPASGTLVTSVSPTFTGTIGGAAETLTGIFTDSQAGAASASAVNITGAPFTGGSGTTTFPLVYLNSGAAPTTFSTLGTILGLNSPSAFTGNYVDFHLNGGNSVFKIDSTGQGTSAVGWAINSASAYQWSASSKLLSPANGVIQLTNSTSAGLTRLDLGLATSSGPAFGVSGTTITAQLGDGTSGGTFAASNYATVSNCSSAASPAVCGSAAAGSVAVPTGTNATLQVNTTAVTANSQIFVQSDDTLGTKLSVTCNSTLASLIVEPVVSARSAGASFTITISGTTTTNPVCLSYFIVN